MKVTKTIIKRLFVKCETAFESCWDTLVKLKTRTNRDEDFVKQLILFQETLAIPLFELQRVRNLISAQEKDLIARKKQYATEWFKKQMKCLSDYKKGIDQVRSIGKGLGDAFAYFFYRRDLSLLEKQFGHVRIDTTISGTGLKGELSFVKSAKHIEGKLVIYHGITNILRYGDFSLYDLQAHRIAEIGEMKTKKSGENQYQLMMTLVSTTTITEPPEEFIVTEIEMDQVTASRLQRQVDAIAGILKKSKDTVEFQCNIEGTTFAEQLEKLYQSAKLNQFTHLKVSDGLLYTAVRLPNATLFTRIFNRKISGLVAKLGDEAISEVRQLLKPDSNDNNIILGTLLYYPDYIDKNHSGTAPLFWYPLSNNMLKDLYFSNLHVITIFNPAHILHAFRLKGYNVQSKYNSHPHEPGKNTISYFDSLLTLITNHLQTEDSILQMIETTVKTNQGKFSSVVVKPSIIMSGLFGMSGSDNH